jgi:YegS/Rv2252/BmrU family lipid kinase
MQDNFWYIIANPVSGGGATQKRWPQIEQLLQQMGFSYTVQFTEYRGHATRLAEDAILKGHRNIMGVGGDGTNHEIINGIIGQSFVSPLEVLYTIMPVGTGNDWARTFGIPFDPQKRLERLLEGNTAFQDIGLVKYMRDGQPQQRYFAGVAGLAYDGYIGKALDKDRPTALSRLQYLAMVAKYLFKYELSEAAIQFDGQTARDFFYTINVGLCRYSAGGMQLVPHAIPDDGLFALTFARKLPKYEVLLMTPRFYNGTILSHRKVEGHQAKSIRVDHIGDTPTLLEADGEFLGQTPVEFTLLEKALKIAL